jgi:hypothetical protein
MQDEHREDEGVRVEGVAEETQLRAEPGWVLDIAEVEVG